jgi:hypothetical protein
MALYSARVLYFPMAGVPKGQKRSWSAGKPKFTNGELVKTIVLLSEKHRNFLKARGEGHVSAAVRQLVEDAMARREKASKNKI